jgi:hypothetical protein
MWMVNGETAKNPPSETYQMVEKKLEGPDIRVSWGVDKQCPRRRSKYTQVGRGGLFWAIADAILIEPRFPAYKISNLRFCGLPFFSQVLFYSSKLHNRRTYRSHHRQHQKSGEGAFFSSSLPLFLLEEALT